MTEPNTPRTLTMDGVQYPIDSLSNEARATLASMATVEGEMRHLRVQVDIARIAQQALARALKEQITGKPA